MTLYGMELRGVTTVSLPIQNASPSDTYILKEVDGLGPPEVDVSIANTLYQGGVYQGRRPQNREIVAKVGLNPDYGLNISASDLRKQLYKQLSQTDPVTVALTMTDLSEIVTEGYIRRIEIVPFSKEPMVQIVVGCPSPYLKDPNGIVISTFPVGHPDFNYTGDAAVGFVTSFILNETVLTLSLIKNPVSPEGFLSVEYPLYPNEPLGFTINDIITFDTRPGLRAITYERSGSWPVDVTGCLTPTSEWLELTAGENVFGIGSSDDGHSTPSVTWLTMGFQQQYWGI